MANDLRHIEIQIFGIRRTPSYSLWETPVTRVPVHNFSLLNSQIGSREIFFFCVLRNLSPFPVPTSPETPSKRQRTRETPASPTYPTNTNKTACEDYLRTLYQTGRYRSQPIIKEKKEETGQIFSHVLQRTPRAMESRELMKRMDGRKGNKNKQPIFPFWKKKPQNHKTKPQRTKRRSK